MDAMLLAKASLVLSVTLLVAWSVTRMSAAARHLLWSVAFLAVLALPLLGVALPSLAVPVPLWLGPAAVPVDVAAEPLRDRGRVVERTATSLPMVAAAEPSEPWPAMRARSRGAPGPVSRPGLRSLLMITWLAGMVSAAVTLGLSLDRVRRLTRQAGEMDDVEWRRAAANLGARLGLRQSARLLIGTSIPAPMAGGVWRPTIFLPASAREWSPARRDVVLAHEIAHLAVRDPLRHIVTRIALAVYWFHPLAWIGARQAAGAREQACDEAVIALGTRRSDYARVLVELAESVRPAPGLAALTMIQPSLLEKRVMSILNDVRPPRSTRVVAIPAMVIGGLALTIAAARPVAAPPSPLYAPSPASSEPSNVPADLRLETPATAAPPVDAQTQSAVGRESACWWDSSGSSNFSGSMSSSGSGGRTVIHEQVGTRGFDSVIQKAFGDLRMCMVAEELPDRSGLPSGWVGRARRVVIETRRGSAVQRMEIGRSTPSGAPVSWQVGGVARPVDEAAQEWKTQALATLDATWEASMLRGQVSSLHGDISSIYGQRSSLQGEIASLQGDVSSLQGRAASARGEASSLQGEIASIRGHVSSLQGAISSEQGAISSLNASRYTASDADRARLAAAATQHDAEIARIEREIRDYNANARTADVERRLAALNTEATVAAIAEEIRAFNLQGKVTAIQQRIAALDVDGKVSAIERQIQALDADGRVRRLDGRQNEALKRLESAIGSIR